MPRFPDDGKLVPQYEAHCAECQQGVLGLGHTVAAAKKELQEDYGWKKVRGFWTCAKCLAKLSG